MDFDEWFLKIFGCVLICVLIFGLGSMIHSTFFMPHQAEDARQQCLAMGSPSYLEYTGMPFSTKAMGVKCEYPATTQNINLNNTNPLVTINSDK